MYRLDEKQPPFQVMSGPMALQRFEHDREYSKVPDRYRDRFEKVVKPVETPAPEPVKSTKKERKGKKWAEQV